MPQQPANVSNTGPIGPHTIHRFTLSNGVTLLVQENHASPSVVVRGQLWAGAINDPIDLLGLSQFTATAITRGSQKHTFSEINELVEAVGADIYASAGRHLTLFGGKSLAEDFNFLVELLADVLLHPVFPPDELEKIQAQALIGLRELENSSRSQASKRFREQLFTPNHPYSRPANGTLETVPAISREAIASFYQTHYQPRQAIIVVVGDVVAKQTNDLFEQHLHTWQNEQVEDPAPIPFVAPVTGPSQEIHPMPGKSQSDMVLGFVGPARNAANFYPASVGNVILGQLGLGGRLGESVRETHGLAYYVQAGLGAGLGQGSWTVSAGVNGANVEKAIDLILTELRRFTQEPVSEQELSQTKSYMTGILPLQLARNEGIAGTLLHMERHNLGDDYIIRYPDIIKAVTATEILAAAQAYIAPENVTTAIAGDYNPTTP